MLRTQECPRPPPPADAQAIVESMVHPDDRAKVRAIMKNVLSGGEGKDVSFRIVRPDGEMRWLEASGPNKMQLAENRTPLIMMGSVQDVTERKQVEEELKQSEQLHRALFEDAYEALLGAD